ncbi:MAG: DCC1-like thiol-disulfide oxidoreductase family protein [Ferruginibacter sp.]
MKNNKIIIYDDSCPLCAAYTQGFVYAGLIQKDNRRDFTSIDPELLNLLDIKKCPNEIPVIDTETKLVYYGIDAIVEILQTKIPLAKKIIQFPGIRWPLTKLYKLISYNRRVIVASTATVGNFDCTPNFNYKYRLVFMISFLVFNTMMLFSVHKYIMINSFSTISAMEFQVCHIALVALNLIIACCLNKKMAFDYLGQVNMLALATILATVPLMLLNKFHFIQHVFINNIYLLLLTFFVFKEYKRRMHFAGIIQTYPVIYIINLIGIGGFIAFLLLY